MRENRASFRNNLSLSAEQFGCNFALLMQKDEREKKGWTNFSICGDKKSDLSKAKKQTLHSIRVEI